MRILYLILCIGIVSCNHTNDQKQEKAVTEKTDSLPLKRSYQTLRVKAYTYTKLFKAKRVFTDEEYIDIIRLYNTINLRNLKEIDSVFVSFYELFSRDYLLDVVQRSEATISFGIGYYSKKFGLAIGGAATESSSFEME